MRIHRTRARFDRSRIPKLHTRTQSTVTDRRHGFHAPSGPDTARIRHAGLRFGPATRALPAWGNVGTPSLYLHDTVRIFLLTRGLRAVHGELVGWGEGSTRAVGAVRFDARREVGCIDWLVQGQVYGRGRWVRDTRSAEGGAWSEVGEGWGWACAVWCVVWCGKV